MKLDIIIPCYNAAATLQRAVSSALQQPELNTLWLIDDASTDETHALIVQLEKQFPNIRSLRLTENSGAAFARNIGALKSQSDLIAFLDADDAYEAGVLSAAYFTFSHADYAHLGLIRLKLKPVGFPEHYLQHPDFARAWQSLAMTVGGNMVFRRHFFLACGGFPQHSLFRQFGGEDAALGIAITQASQVATFFEENEPAVLHHWRENIHAQRLLDAHLFQKMPENLTPAHSEEAEQITAEIAGRLKSLPHFLRSSQTQGIIPLEANRS